MPESIPDETALQSWIQEAYDNADYDCYNFHKNERVNEGGVDIECESEMEKVLFQVKIRPVKKDIQQLIKFSKLATDRRFYVHWQPPTKVFQNALKRLSVPTLTGRELTEFLVKNRSFGYLRWSLLNTTTLSKITEAVEVIYSSQASSQRALDRQDLRHIWRLKSSGVKVKTVIGLLKDYFVERLQTQSTEENSVSLTNDVFEAIEKANFATEELLQTISRVKEEAPHILSKFLLHVSDRSGWLEFDVRMERSDKAKRRQVIQDWLVEDGIGGKLTSCFTWLDAALGGLQDKLSFFSEGIDWLFASEWKRKFGREFDAGED